MSWDHVSHAIHCMRKRPVPALLECLTQRDDRVRYLAIRSLSGGIHEWEMPEPPEEAVPALFLCLEDSNARVGDAAACALWNAYPGRSGGRQPSGREALVSFLSSDEGKLRAAAVSALGGMGTIDDDGRKVWGIGLRHGHRLPRPEDLPQDRASPDEEADER